MVYSAVLFYRGNTDSYLKVSLKQCKNTMLQVYVLH